jgi:AcrR family transcriptional regulator
MHAHTSTGKPNPTGGYIGFFAFIIINFNNNLSAIVFNIPTGWHVMRKEDLMPRSTAKTDARTKLLEAALSVIRAKGYSATSVDKLCATACVTKGAFFHHFKSKDGLGIAAADHWSETTGAQFADAPYHERATPLDRSWVISRSARCFSVVACRNSPVLSALWCRDSAANIWNSCRASG